MTSLPLMASVLSLITGLSSSRATITVSDQTAFDALSATCLSQDTSIVLNSPAYFIGPLNLQACDTTTALNVEVKSANPDQPVSIMGSKNAAELNLTWELVSHPITELNALTVYRLGPLPSSVLQMYDGETRLQLASTQPFNSTTANANARFTMIAGITASGTNYAYTFKPNQLENFFTLLDQYGGSTELQAMVRTNFYSIKRLAFSAGSTTNSLLTPTNYGYSANGGVGFGMAIMNSPILMDEAGEWYYNSADQYLYYAPLDATQAPANARVVFDVPTGGHGAAVNVSLNANSTFSLHDLKIKQGAWYGLKVRNFQMTSLANLTVQSSEGEGLDIQTGTSVMASRLKVSDTPSFGIMLNNLYNVTLENSTFSRHGFMANQPNSMMNMNFAALRATLVRNFLNINNNTFADAGYAAVSLSENLKTSYVTRNTVTGYCTLLSDCGGIYTFNNYKDTPAMTAVIQANTLTGGKGNLLGTPWTSTSSISPGVYLDNQTSYTQVLDNDISGMTSYIGGIYIHFGNYNTVLRNKIRNGSGAGISLARESAKPMGGNWIDYNDVQINSTSFSCVWLIDYTKVYTDMLAAFGTNNLFVNLKVANQNPFSLK